MWCPPRTHTLARACAHTHARTHDRLPVRVGNPIRLSQVRFIILIRINIIIFIIIIIIINYTQVMVDFWRKPGVDDVNIKWVNDFNISLWNRTLHQITSQISVNTTHPISQRTVQRTLYSVVFHRYRHLTRADEWISRTFVLASSIRRRSVGRITFGASVSLQHENVHAHVARWKLYCNLPFHSNSLKDFFLSKIGIISLEERI